MLILTLLHADGRVATTKSISTYNNLLIDNWLKNIKNVINNYGNRFFFD